MNDIRTFCKILFCTILILKLNYSYAEQSILQPCPSEYIIKKSFFGDGPDERWTNCFGKNTDPANQTYIGEWKNGFPDGQGLLKSTNNKFLLAIFKKQKAEGPAIYFNENGEILETGYVDRNRAVSREFVDFTQFDYRLTRILMKKEWVKYFSNTKPGFLQNCIKFGFSFHSLIDSDTNYPRIHPVSNTVSVIEDKCNSFYSNKKEEIKKITSNSFDCEINNSLSRCNAVAVMKIDGANDFSPILYENLHELVFNKNEWKLYITETNESKESRLKSEEAFRSAKIIEAEKRDLELKNRKAQESISRNQSINKFEKLDSKKESAKTVSESFLDWNSIFSKMPNFQLAVIRSATIESYGICSMLISSMIGSELKGVRFSQDEINHAGMVMSGLDYYRKKEISRGISPSLFDKSIQNYRTEFLVDTNRAFNKYAPICSKLGDQILLTSVKLLP